MNRVFLLISIIIAGIVIALEGDSNQITSYTDGNILLRVYSLPDGTVTKREYFENGLKTRVIEYKSDGIKVETLYDEDGNKAIINKYQDNQLIKSTTYTESFFGRNQELS